MNFGISSFAFSWSAGIPDAMPAQPMTASEFLYKSWDLGVNLVQIGENLPLHSASEAEIEKLIKMSRELGVCVEIGFRGLKKELLKQYLLIARRLVSPIVKVAVDAPGYTPGKDEIVAMIQEVDADYEKEGVGIALENNERLKSCDLLEIIREIDSPMVGACFDPADSLGVMEDVEEATELLAPVTFCLHLKDYVIRKGPHRMGFVIEGVPAGEGMLPIDYILKSMKKHGRCASIQLEGWTPFQNDVKVTCREEEKRLQKSLCNLSKYFVAVT